MANMTDAQLLAHNIGVGLSNLGTNAGRGMAFAGFWIGLGVFLGLWVS